MATVEPDTKARKSLRLLGQRSSSWFVVITHAQGEKKAARELRAHNLQVYVPKRYREILRRKGRAVRNRPLLGGYLFVRFRLGRGSSEALHAIVHACSAVLDLVAYVDSRGQLAPYPLADKTVRDFIDRQRKRKFGRPFVYTDADMLERQRETYTPGRKVRVVAGPFDGFVAEVERFGGLNDVVALVGILGRATRVSFGSPEQELEVLPDREAKRLAKGDRGLSESMKAA